MGRPKARADCAVSNCDTKYDGKISFFRFPRQSLERCLEWLKLCGSSELPNKDSNYYHSKLRVCAKHFSNHMFANYMHDRLLPCAKPVHYLPIVLSNVETTMLQLQELAQLTTTTSSEFLPIAFNNINMTNPDDFHFVEIKLEQEELLIKEEPNEVTE